MTSTFMVEDQGHKAKALRVQMVFQQTIDKKDPTELNLTCAPK